MPATTLLLPARTRFSGLRLPVALARRLGRADRLPTAEAGERAQLLRHFQLLPRGWPVAALTRHLDAGDAASSAWVRADPAWVRPDINGARLMACGEMLHLVQDDVEALLPAVRPLFGDAGFSLDAPTPGRWYLRLTRGTRLPAFVDPVDALGADVFDHLPGVDDCSTQARHWRALSNEAQVLLHNHPWNELRAAAGKPPVNALWFWGAGVLPDCVATQHAQVQSNDPLVQALAQAAGAAQANLRAFDDRADAVLYDLRDALPIAAVISDWLMPMIAAVGHGGLERATLDFVDGARMAIERRQRWRLWRKPSRALLCA